MGAAVPFGGKAGMDQEQIVGWEEELTGRLFFDPEGLIRYKYGKEKELRTGRAFDLLLDLLGAPPS